MRGSYFNGFQRPQTLLTENRTAPITQMKITGRNLLILESTSLVDSVMLQKPT